MLTSNRSSVDLSPVDPEKERSEIAQTAGDLIDVATGPDGPDHKAAGVAPYGRDGTTRRYLQAGVIYANDYEAYILRPSLQPSDYYGRRPLASYIRKGRSIGIRVVRGFDQEVWDRLHPSKKGEKVTKAYEGVSTAHAGASLAHRQLVDPTLAAAERPQVTDLLLVIHGIGQKLSQRVESYHFTYAINAFRREINVELGTSDVKSSFREDMGGIMVLPVSNSSRKSISAELSATPPMLPRKFCKPSSFKEAVIRAMPSGASGSWRFGCGRPGGKLHHIEQGIGSMA